MKKVIILLTALSLLSVISCGKKEAEDKKASEKAATKLEVVTTTGMIADIVENVGGNRVNVTALMGPGTDPHLYKASEGDVSRMAKADIIFYNGLHLEGAMAEVLSKMEGKAFAVTERMDEKALISPEGYEGLHDPHVWFDVRLWMSAVEYVRDRLIEFDRAGAVEFGEDADVYMTQLAELHDYVYQAAKTVPDVQRVLITAHDAFNYFGRAYGFTVKGLQGISTASEAGTADVQELSEFIADRRIASIFVETSVSPKNIEAVQAAVKAKGFEVSIGGHLYSDALGDPGTPEGNYIGVVRHNIATIVNALMGGRVPQGS